MLSLWPYRTVYKVKRRTTGRSVRTGEPRLAREAEVVRMHWEVVSNPSVSSRVAEDLPSVSEQNGKMHQLIGNVPGFRCEDSAETGTVPVCSSRLAARRVPLIPSGRILRVSILTQDHSIGQIFCVQQLVPKNRLKRGGHSQPRCSPR